MSCILQVCSVAGFPRLVCVFPLVVYGYLALKPIRHIVGWQTQKCCTVVIVHQVNILMYSCAQVDTLNALLVFAGVQV